MAGKAAPRQELLDALVSGRRVGEGVCGSRRALTALGKRVLHLFSRPSCAPPPPPCHITPGGQRLWSPLLSQTQPKHNPLPPLPPPPPTTGGWQLIPSSSRRGTQPSAPPLPPSQQVGGDFDPEEYDKQMAAAFGDDYYDAVRGRTHTNMDAYMAAV